MLAMGDSDLEIKIKRSLIISPNLDALLEHEERIGAQTPSTISEVTSSARSSFSRSGSPSDEHLVGLPPPPRHPRRVKTPRPTSSIKDNLLAPEAHEKLAPTSMLVQPTSCSASNPYINPAPTLAELFVDIDALDGLLSHSEVDSRDRSPIITTPPSVASFVPKLSLSHTDHNVLRNHEDRHRKGKITKTPPRLLHNKGKPKDMKNAGQTSHALQREALSSASDRRRPPLISHAKGFANTFSSHQPSMAVINGSHSISRTVYPSSDHSHSYSLNNDQVFSLTKSKRICESPMEIYSLSKEFNLDNTSMDCPQLSPIQFSKPPFSEHSPPLISPDASPSSRSWKPPLPTTPKPVFSSTSLKPSRRKTSGPPLPPTTNHLEAEERADLVRKTRKLTRVFGQTPRADAVPHPDKPAQEAPLSQTSLYPSILNDLDWPILRRRRSVSHLESPSISGARRYSLPLSPNDMPLMAHVSIGFDGYLSPSSNQTGHHAKGQTGSKSPRSYIDLSMDTLDGGDTMPEADRMTPVSSVQSQDEKMFPDEDRRRKRERLAKLHRFLGSRVPANLVLGIDADPSLPPPQRNSTNTSDPRKNWIQRRRSSSALPPHWPNDLERVKEELNDKEKLINVRRAVKMEKVFGVAPPQTLYHTRQCTPPLLLVSKSEPSGFGAYSFPTPSLLPQQNHNRSAYLKHKPKKNGRPGTSESNTQLLPQECQSSEDLLNASESNRSVIYNHYQHSLRSLHDILDRDDRDSLFELHQYLNAGEVSPTQLEMSPTATGRRISNASSIKSARRRSLPERTSFDSEYSVITPEIDTFQERRRKATKLTQFFGVDYRELISDILQSIENGVEHDHMLGTLCAEEVEELCARLRKLKAKRQDFL